MLLLDSLYEDEAARRQIQLQNAGYGSGTTAAAQSLNPFDQLDPFMMSNDIAPPTNVQMALMAQQQQQQQYPNKQLGMTMFPFGAQQPYHQQPPYGSQSTALQTGPSNPFGDPFSSLLQQRPMQPHENHHLL